MISEQSGRPGDIYDSPRCGGGNNFVKTRNSVKSQPWVLTSQNALLMGGKLLIGRFLRPFYWAMNPWNNLLFFRHLVFVAMKRLIQNLFRPGV